MDTNQDISEQERRPRTIKACRMRKWVEEDMTIESTDTIETDHNERGVSHDDNTWDEYLQLLFLVVQYQFN